MSDDDYLTLSSRDPFSNEYLRATVEYGGKIWKDAEIRFKGKSSRFFSKKPFRIKFPHKHPFEDAHEINLNAMFYDKSFLREKLAWSLFGEMGTIAPHAEYATLTINQQPKGLYLRLDKIDKHFLKRRGYPESSLYEADGYYSLADLSEQPLELLKAYYPKSVGDTDDYSDLEALIHALKVTPDSEFAQVVDSLFDIHSIDNWFAGNILMQMGDSYTKNYFLYRDTSRPSRQWQMIPWDYDQTFGLSGDLAVTYPNSLLNQGFIYSIEPLSGPESVLRNRFLATPSLMDGLRKRVDTLLSTIFTEEHLFPRIDSLASLIAGEVEADTVKWGTNEEFRQSVDALKYFITVRRNFLLETFIHKSSTRLGKLSLPINDVNIPCQFVDTDGCTVATMWFLNVDGLRSMTVAAHADSIPPCLNPTDTSLCVRRWLEIIPYPNVAKFTAKLRWMYWDASSTDREVGHAVTDERKLVCDGWIGNSTVRFPSIVNPICNVVTIESITEKDCGSGKYFYLHVP